LAEKPATVFPEIVYITVTFLLVTVLWSV